MGFSTVGGAQKNVTKNIRKYPVDEDGVRQQYEARNWHQDDVELWDPAVPDTIEDLHEDGEDAISLNDVSFPYALEQFPYLFVQFYSGDCAHCEDLAPTWEALGEVVTDTSTDIVDQHMEKGAIDYSDDEYESAVNAMAPALVTKVNCSVYPDICKTQGVRVYPTMRVFVDGKAKADYNGHRTVMELVHFLTHIEAEHRDAGQLKMHQVLEHASERTVRNEEERVWNNDLAGYRAPHHSWNITNHGCQLSGSIMVEKSPGKFLVHAQSYGHDIAAQLTNVSHIVHHFSFGDLEEEVGARRSMETHGLLGMSSRFFRSLHPMDENVYVTGELHQAYHHHLRVVATEFGDGPMFQWARNKLPRVFRILHNSQLSLYRRHVVPAARWSYDIDAMLVSYNEESRTWYDYVTGVLAIVGGAFTVVGMMDVLP